MKEFKFNDDGRDRVGRIIKGLTLYTNFLEDAIDQIEEVVADQLPKKSDPGESSHPVWQKCPKCDGQGIVAKPPWVAGDVHLWSSTSTSFPCDVCNGAKIISTPK